MIKNILEIDSKYRKKENLLLSQNYDLFLYLVAYHPALETFRNIYKIHKWID